MTDDDPTEAGFTYSYTTQSNIETADFDLEALEQVMREFRQKFDNDVSRALFSSPPHPLFERKPPKIEYEPEDRPFGLHMYGFGLPVYESRFIPRGEGVAVAGHGVFIGTGPASDALDKIGLDLGYVYYTLPKWAIFAILALALMLLVLLVA